MHAVLFGVCHKTGWTGQKEGLAMADGRKREV